MAIALCHVLIGIPGSGKSTFARKWIEADPSYSIISTDRIREQLFGDESIQGDWKAVEARVFEEIIAGVADGTPMIYDATNAKRPWRLEFLRQIDRQIQCQRQLEMSWETLDSIEWMAWYLDTDIATCKHRNRQRQRTVPDAVVDEMAVSLQEFPPCISEGFADVNAVPLDDRGNYDFPTVFGKIQTLSCHFRSNCGEIVSTTLPHEF